MKNKGSVTLVGAGCGKGLMTVSGMEHLRSAEVVVYDDLIDTELLLEVKRDCELVYVGKRFARHSEKQNRIEEILIEKAREGKKVVRLKGGDSFVFGRGGEEMEALRDAGIPAQVIPGISSGIAVPEHLGIPVTHRGVAQTLTFITGHVASDDHIDYSVLAKMEGTLVFFMGLHHAEEIAEKLIAGGKDSATPAAILSDGYGTGEEKKTGTLENLGELAKTAKTPALILVGQVAELDYSSTMEGSLTGTSVTVTGTRYFTDKLEKILVERGACVVRKPGMEILPMEENYPESYEQYRWIAFTSANGVRGFFDHLRKTETDLRELMHLKFACIGSGSAGMLKKYGFTADLIPENYTAEALGKALGEKLADSGEKLLILRAENGSELLNLELNQAGICYDDCKIYRTGPILAEVESQREKKTDYLVFASANGAKIYLKELSQNLERGLVDRLHGTTIVCIGEATADALQEFGIDEKNSQIIFPKSHTAEAIADAIENGTVDWIRSAKTGGK